MFLREPQILFVDNHLLVVRKPAGMLVQADATGDFDLLSWGKQWIKREFAKPGDVFLGLVHRLDRPVSGVVVFARTSKAASRLSQSFRERTVGKTYWALVEGETPPHDTLRGFLKRERTRSRMSDDEMGSHAELRYRRLGYAAGISWLEVELGTGRHHQIRLQLADAGHPIVGDFKYRAPGRKPGPGFGGMLALHARSLSIAHPVKDEICNFSSEPDAKWREFAAFQPD